MKKLIVLSCALSLAGCATAPMQKMLHHPVMHHTAPIAAPEPAPIAVTPPAAPVVVTKMGKPRWYDETKSAGHWVADKVRSHLHRKEAK